RRIGSAVVCTLGHVTQIATTGSAEILQLDLGVLRMLAGQMWKSGADDALPGRTVGAGAGRYVLRGDTATENGLALADQFGVGLAGDDLLTGEPGGDVLDI